MKQRRQDPDKTVSRRSTRRQSGFSLVEVMVSFAVASLMFTAIFQAVMLATRSSYSNAQYITAFSLCKERIEEMQSTNYNAVASSLFTNRNVTVAYLTGSKTNNVPVEGTRSTIVQTVSGTPEYKRVKVGVYWHYRGRHHQQEIETHIFPE